MPAMVKNALLSAGAACVIGYSSAIQLRASNISDVDVNPLKGAEMAVGGALEYVYDSVTGHKKDDKDNSKQAFEASLRNTNCFGNDITFTLGVKSAKKCSELCNENTACAAYVWCYGAGCNFDKYTCWQKDSTAVSCLQEGAGQMPGRIAAIKRSYFESMSTDDQEVEAAAASSEEVDDEAAINDTQLEDGNVTNLADDNVTVGADVNATDEQNVTENVTEILEVNATGEQNVTEIVDVNVTLIDDNSTEIEDQMNDTLAPTNDSAVAENLTDSDFAPVVDVEAKDTQLQDENATVDVDVDDTTSDVADEEQKTDVGVFETLSHTNCPGHRHINGNDGSGFPTPATDFKTDSIEECRNRCAANEDCHAYVYCWDDAGCRDGTGQMESHMCMLKDGGCIPWLRQHVGENQGYAAGIRPGVKGAKPAEIVEKSERMKVEQADEKAKKADSAVTRTDEEDGTSQQLADTKEQISDEKVFDEAFVGCFALDVMYRPQMENSEHTKEKSPQDCQARCAATEGCAHFSFFRDGACLLQGSDADTKPYTDAIAGPAKCE